MGSISLSPAHTDTENGNYSGQRGQAIAVGNRLNQQINNSCFGTLRYHFVAEKWHVTFFMRIIITFQDHPIPRSSVIKIIEIQYATVA